MNQIYLRQGPLAATTEDPTFRVLFEDAPVAYHQLDADGTVRRVNWKLCDLLGYTADEMIGCQIWMFAEKDAQEEARLTIRRRLAGTESPTPARRNFVRKDQRLITVEVHSTLILGENGTIVGIHTAFLVTCTLNSPTRSYNI